MTSTDDTSRRVPNGDTTFQVDLRECEQAKPESAHHYKLWAALAAVEIEAMGRDDAFAIDSLLEARLEALGGSVAVRRLGRVVEHESRTPGADLRVRAWMLGEIETLGELAGGLDEATAAWLDEVRGADPLEQARRRVEEAETSRDYQVRYAVDKAVEATRERQRAERAEARALQAEARVRELEVALAWARAGVVTVTSCGSCLDALNTEPDEAPR